MTDQTLVLAGIVVSALASITSLILTNRHTERIAELGRDVKATKDNMVEVEKNTNHISTQLAKVTGEQEFARGLKQGAGLTGESANAVIADAVARAARSTGELQGAADEKSRALAESTKKAEGKVS